MARISSFEDLEAWKRARVLAHGIYQCSAKGALARDTALRDQIRRPVVSVISNIAEGFDRGGDKEFIQFLFVAKGSCAEVKAQLYVALDQRYLTQEEFQGLSEQTSEVGRLIGGPIRYLQRSELRGRKYKPR
ncbi:MAG TPA: four helix bundle protein [Candidatus Kryptonia bacterium]|nr:four helix bundle protein [Candidatus Kryptonia bacterium]